MELTDEEKKALHEERIALMEEYFGPKAIEKEREETFRLERLMAEEDADFEKSIRNLKKDVQFLKGEAMSGDLGEEMYDFALEEIEALEKQIEDSCLKKSATPGDIWAQYPPARRRLLDAQTHASKEGRVAIGKRLSEIDKLLPPVIHPNEKKEPDEVDFVMNEEDEKPFHMYMIPPAAAWNNAVRRIEYYNYSGLDNLPPIEEEPWDWTKKQWIAWEDKLDEELEALPPELWDDPLEEAQMEFEAVSNENHWLKIQLNRENRLTSVYKEETNETISTQERTIISYNAKRFAPKKHWHPDMDENIRQLQKMGLTGNSVEVLFSTRDKHVQRGLIVRWGVDVGYATRINFSVTSYEHMNNFYGKLAGHPNTTILLGLQLDRMNKVRVKTALRPMDEADEYLRLERKHLPGGVGYSGYTKSDLFEAHKKIMAELNGKKGPRR